MVVDPDKLKKQIEILRLRQQATRLALILFEVADSQAEVESISQWVEISTHTNNEADIRWAINRLQELAQDKKLFTDL